MEQNIYKSVFKVNHAGGSGTCFYLRSHNLFVTNYHVVEGFRQVAIQDNDRNAYLADVVLVNPNADLALLKAGGDFSALPEIRFSEGEIAIGHRITVAGYPFGMPFTVTEGTVSSPRQLVGTRHLVQTDAAVNPGNSGGPMFNENGELVTVTVSKINDADNMGFGIPVDTLREVLGSIEGADTSLFHVQCPSCDELLAEEEEEFCPSCGEKMPENIFAQRTLTELAQLCEKAIEAMGINPVLARRGGESWVFHKGSSEIRLFVYQRSYLFCTSPVALLPKKDLEPILTYIVGEDMRPYKMGVDGNQIYIAYRIHISDLFSEHRDEVMQHLVNLAHKADELDNFLVEKYGCEFSECTKKDAI